MAAYSASYRLSIQPAGGTSWGRIVMQPRGVGVAEVRCPACGREVRPVERRPCDGCGSQVVIDRDGLVVVARAVGTGSVGVAGEVDMSNERLLRDALSEAAADDPAGVQLDLVDLTFIDARGAAVFVELANRVAKAGGEVVLRYPSRNVLRVLEAARLTQLFRIDDPGEGDTGR
jgi:anti-anti-sigma factor